MTAVSVTLPAQTRTIVYGRTTITNSAFLQYVASFNVTTTDLAGNPIQNNSTVFPVTEGAIDLRTAAGEVTNSGGYIFRGNGNSVRIENLVVDTTTPTNPVVTAIFVVNDKLVGRVPLYQVTIPAGTSLPQSQAGTEEISGLNLTLTKAAATLLNGALIITEPVLQANSAAGTADVYAVFAATN